MPARLQANHLDKRRRSCGVQACFNKRSSHRPYPKTRITSTSGYLSAFEEGTALQLVEQHVIRASDPRFAIIDEVAFASKNLYNAALYELRQAFIFQGRYLPYGEMAKRMQRHEANEKLPAKVAQKVL